MLLPLLSLSTRSFQENDDVILSYTARASIPHGLLYTLCSLPWNDAPMKELFLNNAAMRVVFVYILWLVEFGLANPAIYL